MIPYEEQKEWHICQREFCYDKNDKKKFNLYKKVRDHCSYAGKIKGAAHSICKLNHKVPQQVPVKSQNGSKYDHHFIIKKIVEEFKDKFECLEKIEKNILPFQYQLKKKVVMIIIK